MKVVIDGNIGSGKTTQLNLFQDKGFRVHREPIDDWPLEVFYSNPERWQLMFQLRVIQTLPEIKFNTDKRFHFFERSKFSALHVFWQYALDCQLVSYWEDIVLRDVYDKVKCEPDLYIYIRRSPIECFRSIQRRNQAGDSKVELKYIERLSTLYEKMIHKIPCPVHIIEADGRDPDEVHREIIKVLQSKANELHSFDP
jgi:deoxyadenosine/deoxycytidine kinase